jgi:hypothetical protein
MNPRSFFAPSAIALATLTALAGCGDDASSAPAAREVPSDATTADAPAVALPAPNLRTELTATTAGAARATVPVPALPARVVAPTRSATPPSGQLRISRLVLARDVVDRAPVGAATSFRAADGERLYAFLEVRNDAATDAPLIVTFRRVDSAARDERGGVTLTVPAAQRRWRTWSFTRQARTPGSWEALVRTVDGRELARTPFTVE